MPDSSAFDHCDRFLLEDRIWLVTSPTGVPVYDFDFRRFFNCRTPYEPPQAPIAGVARIGAIADYAALFESCKKEGIELVHSPEEHLRCASLPIWYPLLEGHTPRSKWYETVPSLADIEADFELPVFVKGARQTSRHKASASVIRTRTEFEAATAFFKADPILHWQDFVCREFVPLRPVSGGVEGKIPASFEFRTFWWRGRFAGGGRYWHEADSYAWTEAERARALSVAEIAVKALNCAFLVVDMAQKADGDWIIVECNDGMESGYAGASPFTLWRSILDFEKPAE